jgi:hypothetical protein
MLPLFADAPEPTAPASAPLRIVPRATAVSARNDADFPSNWRQDSREWAETRQFTRADVNTIEADRARFRAIRDAAFLARCDVEVARETERKMKATGKMAKLVANHEADLKQLQRSGASKHKIDEAIDNFRYERGNVRLLIKEAEWRLAWLGGERTRIMGEQKEKAA